MCPKGETSWESVSFSLTDGFDLYSFWFQKLEKANGNPLQFSCLENPIDRGAWAAAVHRVSKSCARLSSYHSSLVSETGEHLKMSWWIHFLSIDSRAAYVIIDILGDSSFFSLLVFVPYCQVLGSASVGTFVMSNKTREKPPTNQPNKHKSWERWRVV